MGGKYRGTKNTLCTREWRSRRVRLRLPASYIHNTGNGRIAAGDSLSPSDAWRDLILHRRKHRNPSMFLPPADKAHLEDQTARVLIRGGTVTFSSLLLPIHSSFLYPDDPFITQTGGVL